ncbi:hypothetical protein AGMMS49975_04990 [Clostridia bacterium]|nr:hypothetical protein AGMMS49975_04990 [Clostridia bacterium]
MGEDEFLEKCRQVDFSAESEHKREILEKILNKRENIKMKKIGKKGTLVIAAAAVLVCASAFVYGGLRIFKTEKVGDYAAYTAAEETNNKDTSDISVTTRVNETAGGNYFKSLDDKKYFITEALLPSYLPSGYAFDAIEYFGDPTKSDDPNVNKFMNLHYKNGDDEIIVMVRYMDESTAFEFVSNGDVTKIDINGNEAVQTANKLDIEINGVMYMLYGNDSVGADELVKIAQSLE